MKTFIRVRRDFNLITDIATDFSIPIENDRVDLPPELGVGALKGYSFPLDLNLYVGRYALIRPWELETINELDTGAFCIFTSVLSDKITVKVKGEWVTINNHTPQGFFFYSPGTSVEVRYPEHEPFKTVAVTFTGETIKALFDDNDILTGIDPTSPFLYFDETVPEATKRIAQLASIADDNGPSRIETYLTLLTFLKLILRRIFVSKDRYNLSGLMKEDIETIFFIKSRLLQHSEDIPTIASLALLADMSERKLVKLFKQVFARTIYQFAQEAKLMKAKELLSSKLYNVSEVGDLVGYTNMTHFGKAFKKYHRVNPSEYLKRVLNPNALT